MPTYNARTAYLLTPQADGLSLTFDMLEDANRIGIRLPSRASVHRQWWGDPSTPGAHRCVSPAVGGLAGDRGPNYARNGSRVAVCP
jgi:hypothetical protein